MSRAVRVAVFAEDRAHEEFLRPLVLRVARELGVSVSLRVVAARGGHGQALREFRLFQSVLEKGVEPEPLPDVIVVGIDGNCATFTRKRDEIRRATVAAFENVVVAATPDPHVECWFLADPPSVARVVGVEPKMPRKKCVRDQYKRLLADTVRAAGHPVTLGGLEFASELVEDMDLYRASTNDRSLEAFHDELASAFRRVRD